MVRCERRHCDGRYEVRFDTLGRMVGACPACARRKAGLCVTCGQPAGGVPGQRKYCPPCKVISHRACHQRYVNNDRERYNAKAAARIRKARAKARGDRPLMDPKTIGTLRGLARAKALSPERRREIAAQASKTRWQKYYQRQMLKRMREAAEAK